MAWATELTGHTHTKASQRKKGTESSSSNVERIYIVGVTLEYSPGIHLSNKRDSINAENFEGYGLYLHGELSSISHVKFKGCIMSSHASRRVLTTNNL